MNPDTEQNHDGSKGMFITFEGGEGAGKTTHINFLAETLRGHGCEVLCIREPGGTAIGEQLRAIVLDVANEEMTRETELLIYEAARAQIVEEVLQPALAKGTVVLCDRFCDSTLAYQAYGRGLPLDFVRQANEFACKGIHPVRTILLTCGNSVKDGLERATHHAAADRLELAGIDFHERVRIGFSELAAQDPERIRTVESADRKSQTARAIFAELTDLFPWLKDERYTKEHFFARVDEGYYGNKQQGARGFSSAAEPMNGGRHVLREADVHASAGAGE